MGRPEDGYTDVLRSVVATGLPDYRFESAQPLGEGLDNVAFRVNDELVVRFRKEEDPALRADSVRWEARILAAVAEISPLPVPRVAFTVPEHGCIAHFALPGVLLPVASGVDVPAVAARLGELLRELHTAPQEPLADLVDVDDFPLAEWLSESAQLYADLGDAVPAPARRPIESFLDERPPDAAHTPVFSHNDLGSEHVLVDAETSAVTGIIDWGDAAIVDPAYDFGLILRDLGPGGLDAALTEYPGEHSGLRRRAVFYARCSVLEDLAFGLENSAEDYIERSVAALGWLFPG